jgi:thymidylate kinase
MSNRTQFLHEFFSFLEPYPYAVLKMIHASIESLPEASDVDLLVKKEDLTDIETFCRQHPKVKQWHFQKKSFIWFVCLLFEDGTYLEIDLLHRFDRKGIVYIDAEEVLREGVGRQGELKVLTPAYSFEYIILFYLLNHAAVPEKYREWFAGLSFEVRSNIFGHICGKYKINLNTLDELYKPASRHRNKINAFISQLHPNRKYLKPVQRLRYLADMGSDLINNEGTIITFSGVDGAGKSTILENMRRVLHDKYRKKVVVLRHRPSLLPILSAYRHGKKKAESMAAASLPRQGKNTSSTGSLFRFLYYYSDYVFGQFYINLRYVRRGYTVLYDRYYFDFIVDAQRSNIRLPKSIMKFGYHFLMKPKLNVFLYAPSDLILQRKQEMKAEEIEQLTGEYKSLFEEFGKNYPEQEYLALNNIDLKTTLNTVEKHCIKATF